MYCRALFGNILSCTEQWTAIGGNGGILSAPAKHSFEILSFALNSHSITLTLNWNWNRSFHDEWWIAATSGSKVIFMMWMWNCGCTTWSAPHLNWNLFLPTVAAMVLCASSRTSNPACLHNVHHLLVQCAIQRLVLIEELRSNMLGMTKLAGIALNTTASGIRMSNIFLRPDPFFFAVC